ncbi:MAG: ribosomal protein S18-alanine N-acetyltransferase, partial [Methyloligellaceae bacterium]
AAARIRLEPRQAADIKQVAAIDRLSFPTPWPENAFDHELLRNERSHFLVARIITGNAPWYARWRAGARRIIGYVGYWLVLDEAHISTIAVRPEYRRRGIGAALLMAILRDAVRRGAAEATLEVREGNREAQSLYQKYGFELVGHRKGYYRDSGEDALLMTANPILLEPDPQALSKVSS